MSSEGPLNRDDLVRIILDSVSEIPACDPNEHTPLLEGGLELDSIALLELVVAVERAAGVRLRSEDLDGRALATVGSLADHVLVRRLARG